MPAFRLVQSELHVNWNSVPVVGGLQEFQVFAVCYQPASPSQSRQQSQGDMRKPPKECADAEHAPRVLPQKKHPQSWFHKGKISEASHHPRKAWQLGEHGVLKHFTEATDAHIWFKHYFRKTKVRQPSELTMHICTACQILETTITYFQQAIPYPMHLTIIRDPSTKLLRWKRLRRRYQNKTKVAFLTSTSAMS